MKTKVGLSARVDKAVLCANLSDSAVLPRSYLMFRLSEKYVECAK